jgi:hypothetical protein
MISARAGTAASSGVPGAGFPFQQMKITNDHIRKGSIMTRRGLNPKPFFGPVEAVAVDEYVG